MKLYEMFEILADPKTIHQDYIVLLRYKDFDEYKMENQLLLWDDENLKYNWAHEWGEGIYKEDIIVLGFVSVAGAKVPIDIKTLMDLDETFFIDHGKAIVFQSSYDIANLR